MSYSGVVVFGTSDQSEYHFGASLINFGVVIFGTSLIHFGTAYYDLFRGRCIRYFFE